MDFSTLTQLASGHAEARIVQAAVELELFDCIAEDSFTAAEIAAKLNTNPAATELLVNALTALTLLELRGTRFSLSDAAKTYLKRDAPQSLRAMILFDASLWDCWGRLAETVRTGKPARPPDMYQDKVDETAIFIDAMDSLVKARGDAEVLANVLNWQGVTRLLDIGSGPATYPIYLCQKLPELRVTVFDLPGTLELTRRYVHAAGLETRFTLIAGDYRQSEIPGRYQAIFLSNIIHGEGYEVNAKLMAALSGNLEPGGRIIIKDHILDENRAKPPVGAIFSLLMLLTTKSGRCYSFGEIKAWLETAGLQRIERIELPPPLTSSLIVAEK
jgi:O-methyltransferase domain/Dimerisation domain